MIQPPIPTDNLYKFIALAGVVIGILIYVVPIKSIEDLQVMRNATRVELDDIAFEFDRSAWRSIQKDEWKAWQLPSQLDFGKPGVKLSFPEDFEDEMEQQKVFAEVIRKFAVLPTESQRANLLKDTVFQKWVKDERGWTDKEFNDWSNTAKLKDVRDVVKEPVARAERLNARLVEYRKRYANEFIERNRTVIYRRWLWWGQGIAVFAIIYGFTSWYISVQRHHDTLLRSEAAEAELSLAQKQAEAKAKKAAEPPLTAAPPTAPNRQT